MVKNLILFSFLFYFPIHSFEKKTGDFLIEGFEPPKEYWEVNGGSCGEACLFSIAEFFKLSVSQKKINQLANSPGRGIYSNEVLAVLKKLKIPYINLTRKVDSQEKFIENILIENLKKKQPIFLGVKIYPDETPKWVCDHFILLVGYNELTKELIYNSDNGRDRISIQKLLNKKNGYSLIHKSYSIFAISITVNPEK